MKKKPLSKKRWSEATCRQFLLLIAFSLLVSVANAQSAIPVSGGNASGETGTLSYSVGQVAYTAVAGTAGILSQGVQQPFEILVLTDISGPAANELRLSAYPNPTTGDLILSDCMASLPYNQKPEYRLYDMHGRLLQSGAIRENETIISMGHLMPSVYFLKIINGNLEVKSFKIVKK